jgi:hypothetical protein
MPALGVVIYALPQTRYLEDCLKSVEWADEVRVVRLDPRRPAEAIAIASPFARPVDRILHLWGDERLGHALQRHLVALRRDGFALPVYRARVRAELLGTSVAGSPWGSSPSPRLKPRLAFPASSWCEDERMADEREALLEGCIHDRSLDSLSEGMGLIDAVSTLWAETMRRRETGFRAAEASFFSLRVFFRLLSRALGAGRAFAALTLAVLGAYAVLLSRAKLWEAERGWRRR